MKKVFVFLTILIISTLSLFADEIDYSNSHITLDKGWELYLQKTPEQAYEIIDKGLPSDFTISIPDKWNDEIKHYTGKDSGPETYGCYRYVCRGLDTKLKYSILIKDSPATSYIIYVNRQMVFQMGDPYFMTRPDFNENLKAYNPSHSKNQPAFCEFFPDKNGEVEIIIFVANYFYRKSGLWDTVYFGKTKDISRMYTVLLVFYSIVIGCLFFIGLLNLIQFLLNKKRWEYFYLGITSIVFALRIGTASFCVYSLMFPDLSFELKCKLEYMVLWVAPISILQMLFHIYPSNNRIVIFKWLKEKKLRHTLILIDLILGLISLIVPAYYSNRLVPPLQIGMGIIAIYVVSFSISNLIKRKKYSFYILLSYSTLSLGAIVDIIYTRAKTLIPISFFPFFLVVFVIIQIFMLAVIQNDIYKSTLKSSDELNRLNEAYLRFVPKEFLRLLNRESIINTKLGDYSNIEMCIMFSKVKIECDNDSDSLEEHFLIFNDYLKKVSPIIKKYDGFVSKFLSGGFMALFPNSEIDAVRAALEINDCVQNYSFKSDTHNHKIEAWTGIHFGKMIIGTIGEENRLDDTVISDTVNTAARIESVCEKLNKNIIVSESLKKFLSQQNILQIQLTPLEAIYVKGKEKPLDLFEITRKSKNELNNPEVL